MFLQQPIDHRKTIYQNLSLYDLVNLSLVCKHLYFDQTRKEVVVQRYVDQCFYLSNPIPTLPNPFPSICTYEHFVSKLYESMSKLSFSDLCFSDQQIKVVQNGWTRYFDSSSSIMVIKNELGYNPEIGFDLTIRILKNLIEYLSDIWKYSEKNPNTNLMHDAWTYILSITAFLGKIFVEETDEIRLFLFRSLYDFQERTKESKHSPKFDIGILVDDIPIKNTLELVDIGDFLLLQCNNPYLLYRLLARVIDPYLDVEYNAGNELLIITSKYSEDKDSFAEIRSDTYMDRLFELFEISGYDRKHEFIFAQWYRSIIL